MIKFEDFARLTEKMEVGNFEYGSGREITLVVSYNENSNVLSSKRRPENVVDISTYLGRPIIEQGFNPEAYVVDTVYDPVREMAEATRYGVHGNGMSYDSVSGESVSSSDLAAAFGGEVSTEQASENFARAA